MRFSRIFLLGALGVFCVIGGVALWKRVYGRSSEIRVAKEASISSLRREISGEDGVVRAAPAPPTQQELSRQNLGLFSAAEEKQADGLPAVDRVFQLFTTGASRLPIVETVVYQSAVPWLKGRPAWVADYAVHFGTSRHFIARSLNGRPDYFSQKVAEGSRFNVFRKDKKVQFWLLVDVSRCRMGFYYFDEDTNERVLLKTYRVGLGRLDPQKPSGTLTPLGRYLLGDRVAIYQPGTMGFHQDQKVEMVRVFGTRWLPFGEGLERCSAPARGYGLQGVPWVQEGKGEANECLGRYESDGCIRLSAEDIEELYAIVITKPTYVEIVRELCQAHLPGVEVATPTR